VETSGHYPEGENTDHERLVANAQRRTMRRVTEPVSTPERRSFVHGILLREHREEGHGKH
jgi:hypothetical protein